MKVSRPSLDKQYCKQQFVYNSFPQTNISSFTQSKYIISNSMKQNNLANTLQTQVKNPLEPKIDKADYFYQGQTSNSTLQLSQSLEFSSANNKKNVTPEILGAILDDNQKFSPNSPSNLKLCQKEIDLIQTAMDNDLSSLKFTGDNPNSYFLSAIETAMEILDSDSNFENMSLQSKTLRMLKLIEIDNRKCRLGCITILYLTLKKYWDEIEQSIKENVIEKVISILQNNYETQEELYLVSCLNICSLYGPDWMILLENIGLISMFITDFNYPYLQRATFVCLMSLEYEGIRTLIELSSKDYQEFQQYILSSLLRTPHIQKIIIVRALINELNSLNNGRILEALSALNRLYDIVDDKKIINYIGKLFYENKFKNCQMFIASILRTSGGNYGEAVLLTELDRTLDQTMRELICKILGFRLERIPNYLEMRLDRNDTDSIVKNPPGLFCKYFGQVTPVIGQTEQFFSEIEKSDESEDLIIDHSEEKKPSTIPEYLEVSTRDFFASLKRMLTLNYEHSKPEIVYKNQKQNLLDEIDLSCSSNEKIFSLLDFINPYPIQNNDYSSTSSFYLSSSPTTKQKISNNIIASLIKHLKDQNIKVRTASAISLGQIGLPEALPAIEHLSSNLKESDINLKAAIIWAIGRCAEGASNTVIPQIIQCLENKMWKVKRATLFSISRFGEKACERALPILIKMLRESPINKQLIAEAIVYLGKKGETELLNMINVESDSNYKLQGAIARAFAFINVNSTNLDFIIECLFRLSSSNFPFVRKNALYTIYHLSQKTQKNQTSLYNQGVIYLSSKNLIPFYYEKLKDKDTEIQNYAIFCIKSFGPQGELIFIEGLMKDPNYLIRANCGIGLGEIGVHTIRTLINHGIFDSKEYVRTTVEKIILKKMKIEDVVKYFENTNQLLSLKLLIGEIIDKNIEVSESFKKYCWKLINTIDQIINLSNSFSMNSNFEKSK